MWWFPGFVARYVERQRAIRDIYRRTRRSCWLICRRACRRHWVGPIKPPKPWSLSRRPCTLATAPCWHFRDCGGTPTKKSKPLNVTSQLRRRRSTLTVPRWIYQKCRRICRRGLAGVYRRGRRISRRNRRGCFVSPRVAVASMPPWMTKVAVERLLRCPID